MGGSYVCDQGERVMMFMFVTVMFITKREGVDVCDQGERVVMFMFVTVMSITKGEGEGGDVYDQGEGDVRDVDIYDEVGQWGSDGCDQGESDGVYGCDGGVHDQSGGGGGGSDVCDKEERITTFMFLMVVGVRW